MGGTLGQELKLAKQLKELCDEQGKEICPFKSAPILNSFGLLYKKKSPDKISLIRSAAFYNAACIRQPCNKNYLSDLKQLCSHVLQVAKAEKQDADLVNISEILFDNIISIRNYARNHLSTIKIIPYDLKKQVIFSLEKEKIEKMKRIQKKVTSSFVELMDSVAKGCENILGKAPCQYSIVGMGSLARQEITPFSDFEHIIVLEDGVELKDDYDKTLEYFRWFSAIFQIVVINFKETILRSVAVPLLNDGFITGGDWFYDAYTPCGIKFDGMQIHACKFPLGKTQVTEKHPNVVELIKPVSLMVEYLKDEEELKNGYHLADILTRTCFVSGSKKVNRDFEEKVQEMLRMDIAIGSSEIMMQLEDTINKFTSLKKLGIMNGATRFDIKRTVYRGTTMFISGLGRLLEFKENSCFDIINKMLDFEYITPDWAHNLSYSVAIACEVRMKVYLQQNGQDDIFGIRDFEVGENRTLRDLQDIVGEKSLADYFTIAHSLQIAIISNKPGCLKKMKCLLSDRFLILTCLDLRNLYMFELSKLKRSCDFKGSLKEDWIERVDCNDSLYRIQRRTNMENKLNKDEFEEEPMDAHEVKELHRIIHLTGTQEYTKGNLKAALMHYELLDEQPEVEPLIKIDVIRSKAGLLHDSHQYEEAIRYIVENVEVVKALDLSPAQPLTFLYVTLGNSWRYLKTYTEAFSAYRKALEYHEQLTTTQQSSPYIMRNKAACYFGISECQWNLDDYENALENAKVALMIWSKDENSETILTCICYRHIAKCYLLIGDYEKSLVNLKKELSLRLQYIPSEEHDTNEEIQSCLSLIARILAEIKVCRSAEDTPTTSSAENSP